VRTDQTPSTGRRAAVRGLALSAVAAMALVAGAAGPAAAVANGEPVPQGRYRFATKLTMTNIPRPDGGFRNSACSGALIAPRWVITAGHCFRNVQGVRVSGPVPYPTTATVGTADLSIPGQVVNVVEVFQAEGADVSLARLDRAVRGVRPLGLRTTAPRVGEILRLAGWGATGPDATGPSDRLMTGQVQVGSVAAATIGVHGYAPAPDTSACPWDSGAPYFVERRYGPPLLVSVENTGPDCPHAEEETTARVDTLAGWIRRTIRS
jgi:secreted trypsin-like serine protease